MAAPKLIIRPKKYTEESAVISMRLPKDMLRDIDSIAKYVGCTRNEIMVKCFEFALEHMEVFGQADGGAAGSQAGGTGESEAAF